MTDVTHQDLHRLEERIVARITERVDVGFAGVHDRQDTTNGRIDKLEVRVNAAEVLHATNGQKVRSLEAEVYRRPHRKTDVDPGSRPITRWDLTVAIGVVTALGAIARYFGWL